MYLKIKKLVDNNLGIDKGANLRVGGMGGGSIALGNAKLSKIVSDILVGCLFG